MEIFPQERTLCISALFFWKWDATNLLTNKLRQFASLHGGWMLPAALAQSWRLKSGSLQLLSLVTDASMVREHCWLLQGKATWQIDQQTENKSDNCLLSTKICVHWTQLRDKKFKSSHQMFSARGHGGLGTRLCSQYPSSSYMKLQTLTWWCCWPPVCTS